MSNQYLSLIHIYGEKPALGTVDPCTIIQEGEAIGTFYGFKWAGLQKNDKGQWVDTYYLSLIHIS